MRKVCVVTGTRAEYGLLYWLMKEIEADATLELQLVVTGMHLSPEFGLTYKEVEREFRISKKIEILLSSDTSVGVSKSMGLAQISFAEAYAELSPDIVVVLGDRFEIFSAAAAAMMARIPIAHIHGGEATEGLIDEAIRHSITKMSQMHFTATETYRRRVIQLGEDPKRVFNVGAIGLDNINKLNLLSKDEFEESIGFKLGANNYLITFHPVTLEHAAAKQFQEIICAVDELENTHLIFTKANADTEGRAINTLIDNYVASNIDKAIAFISLGQIRYLSALQYVDAVIGNSSSGIIEAPSFKIGTINIGERQRGRIKAESVIDCEPYKESILEALRTLDANQFKKKLNAIQNPYGTGGASKEICRILSEIKLDCLIKKTFYDLEFCL